MTTHHAHARWPALLLMLAISGCTTVQVDIPPMQATLPQRLDAVDATPGLDAQTDLARWWDTLRDPVLTQLIEEGLKNNTEVRVALARIKEARAFHGMAESAYYPQVDGLAGATRGRQTSSMPGQAAINVPLPVPIPLPMPSVSQDTSTPMGNSTALGLSATWEVDVFGARHSDAEMVQQLVLGAQEQQHGAQLMVAADIANRYFEARGAEKRLDVLQRGVALAQRGYRYALGRYRSGHTNGSDVTRADLQLQIAQAQIEPLKALLASHLRRIAVLMGRAPETLATLPPRPSTSRRPPSLPAVLPGDVLARRPDVRGAERKVRSQAAKVGSARAELLPKFYLGFMGAGGRMHPDGITGTDFGVQTLGLGMRLPLFNAGRIRSNIAANEAQLEGVAIQYEQTVLTALEDVENVYTAHKAFTVRWGLMTQAAKLAAQIAQNKNALFVDGQELLQPTLEAQAAALQREDEAIQSETELDTYTVLLYKALGGGWSDDAAVTGPLATRPDRHE